MMKILYAIQGTGNGHMSRAMDIAPELAKYGEVDYLVSGSQCDIQLPYDVRYKSPGLSFYFGKKGGINMGKTLSNNSGKRILNEIKNFPVEKYDLIINDFEPITAWAAKRKKTKVIGLSHQNALLSKDCPKPFSLDTLGKTILRNYAPSEVQYGFHFHRIGSKIFTPIVRKAIREAEVTNRGHFTVYLPSYDTHKIVEVLNKMKHIEWQVFSKHSKESIRYENVRTFPVNNEKFIDSIVSSAGVLCGAGFETPSEALFLEKKLMVIPMKGQYEQQCNAAALKQMGIPVAKKFNDKIIPQLVDFVNQEPVKIEYPDETSDIIRNIIETEA